ncbi:MAG: heavy metal translocating P-type ATPase metal-binding domain-containing protein [Verrucomicrobium sp.]
MSDSPSLPCQHCGTAVPEHAADPRFCCGGCAAVHSMLLAEGMSRFYELCGAAALAPVAPEALRTRDDGWLREQADEADAIAGPDGASTLTLAIQGVSCVGCVWLIGKVFQDQPGGLQSDVHVARGEVHLKWQPGQFDLPAFALRLQQFGYLLGPFGSQGQVSVQSTSFGRRAGLCGAFAMNAMAFSLPGYLGMRADFLFAPWFDIIAACSATLSVLVGGSYFMERSFQSLRQGVLHMDTPIALGILLAWLGSLVGWMTGEPGLKYFDFVAVFVFLMLTGRWLQQAVVERNRRRLLAASAVPEWALRLKDGGDEVRIPLHEISAGNVLRIPSGAVCPVSGIMESTDASLSLEWINGESSAVTRSRGQAVPSGAVNIGTRSVEVKAREIWRESLLCRLQATAGEAGDKPAASPFLAGYLALVLLLGVAGAIVWWVTGHGVVRALQVMISAFVVSCPCALGVAVPFADELAASRMARAGVFVRSSTLWSRLLRVRKVVFDKTGTLTLENPVLTNPGAVLSLDATGRTALRRIVSSNLHPVSRSLFDFVGPVSQGETERSLTPVEEVVGQGMRWEDSNGSVWTLGRPGWSLQTSECAPPAMEAPDTLLARDGAVVAGFNFADALRPETTEACRQLRADGCKIYLLSGDRKDKVQTVAGQLSIPADHWQAEMTPEEKAERVNRLNQQDTLYIGDGANDTLALAEAFCGGSPVTGRNFLEHRADFYFLGSSLRFMPELLALARQRAHAVRWVFGFALSYNTVAVALSLAGWMSPLLAAVLMPLSSVITLGLVAFHFRQTRRRDSGSQEQGQLEQTMRRQVPPVPIS